jgi:signal transduction histidine kinase
LTEVVNDAVRRFQYILKQGEFRLHQESDGKPLRVLADAEALSQALLNLLDNAVKYSGLSREILLGVHRRGKEVEIRVTDHGIGVPPAEQRRIFESFYRAPGAARETTGAGLGLALVQHFAEAHGGRAAVASGPGRGSAFSLWLPLMENDGQDSDR